ncbi:MAG: fumarate hydratase [Deltaproteobacteria bacterium]|nr:fumarate hydratase [Deltaproteobacteria bacterium]
MKKHFLELIRRAATDLPEDVTRAIERGRDAEACGSTARSALDDVLRNCEVARASSRPLCQDTGTNIWYVYRPADVRERELTRDILAATREATRRSYLRPNAVDSITQVNSGDNTGIRAPVVHFHEWSRKTVHADLLLKGGGCENVAAQLSLPDGSIKAGRDVEGVRKAIIEMVFRAQGRGCGPGIIGVGVGGDRATSMVVAKEQLFRLLEDRNPDETLAKLEERLFAEMNTLGIGPMGFGGATTVLGVKIAKLHRLPASFFVSVAYMCWACRRASVTISCDRATFSQKAQLAAGYVVPGEGKRRPRA